MKTHTQYSPLCGAHILNACREARAIARTRRKPVALVFNGIKLLATRKRSVTSMARDFEEQCRVGARRYRNSGQGKADAARRAKEIAYKQAVCDDALSQINRARSLREVVAWLCRYQDAADDSGTVKDYPAILDELARQGYEANWGVGNPPGWFNTANRLGRYVIGQAMECMAKGMPPHPMLLSFAADYFRKDESEAA